MEKALVFTVFCKGRPLENTHKDQFKINEKSMQFSSGKKRSTKWPEKWIWKGLGLHLGEVWDALGHLLVTFGRILVIFLAFKIISF